MVWTRLVKALGMSRKFWQKCFEMYPWHSGHPKFDTILTSYVGSPPIARNFGLWLSSGSLARLHASMFGPTGCLLFRSVAQVLASLSQDNSCKLACN